MESGWDLWQGRDMQMAIKDPIDISILASCPQVSLCSYNVKDQNSIFDQELRDISCHVSPVISTWLYRSEILWKEISSYDADIFCFQEMNDFDHWKRLLSISGYEAVYHAKQNTLTTGVLIAYRRDLFQLSASLVVDLNDLGNIIQDEKVAEKAGRSDQVALLALLQPTTLEFPTALCIVTSTLSNDDKMDVLRMHQIRYIVSSIEKFNADFQVPVLWCGSFYISPGSEAYHTILTGEKRPEPHVPNTVEQPTASNPTTNSITLQWKPPDSPDGEIIGYKMKRRMGGSTEYLQEEELSNQLLHIVSSLSGGVQYEFKIAARSRHGYGEWSVGSLPLKTTRVYRDEEEKEDDDAHSQFIYTPDEIPIIAKETYSYASSGKTPRFQDGSFNSTAVSQYYHPDPNEEYSTINTSGVRKASNIPHNIAFKSAYASYQQHAEPLYTMTTPAFTGTVDYLFHSYPEVQPFELLSIPSRRTLRGVYHDIPPLVHDVEYQAPTDWCEDKNNQEDYCGVWAPPEIPNVAHYHHYLPNEHFVSDHVAQMCIFAVRTEQLATGWKCN